MARAGMTNLITRLRGMVDAGTADYSVIGSDGTAFYWTDEQLQDILDRFRMDWYFTPLDMRTQYVNGTALYHDYYAPAGDLEEATSGTAIWRVDDSTGADAGTANYTVNYVLGHIRFTASTQGTAYYWTGRSYNLYKAAAEVWRRKASHVVNSSFSSNNNVSEWESDNHRVRYNDVTTLRSNYMATAMEYERMGGGSTGKFVRSDLV